MKDAFIMLLANAAGGAGKSESSRPGDRAGRKQKVKDYNILNDAITLI
jgi:hypothetical protein